MFFWGMAVFMRVPFIWVPVIYVKRLQGQPPICKAAQKDKYFFRAARKIEAWQQYSSDAINKILGIEKALRVLFSNTL